MSINSQTGRGTETALSHSIPRAAVIDSDTRFIAFVHQLYAAQGPRPESPEAGH